jgi:hypothetical protein
VLSGGRDTTRVTEVAPVATDAPVASTPRSTVQTTVQSTVDEPVVTAADPSTGTGGDLAAFCAASEQFYVEAKALDNLDGDADAAARRLFNAMTVSVTGAIFNAPTEALAAAPQRMQDVLAVLLPSLETIDFDVDVVEELPNFDEVSTAFVEFGTILDDLEGFVVSECGADLDALAAAAVDAAADASRATDPSSSDPAAPTTVADVGADEGGAVVVTDDSETISVSVPSTWTVVDGAPDDDLRQLVVAPDIEAFLAGFDSPGVIIVAGDAPSGNGAEAGAAGLDGLASTIEAEGCVLGETLPYDDGVYTGTENIYSCPGTDVVARFAGGSNFDGSIFWLLGVVHSPSEADVWDLITDSFLVD